jgi:hypothetical protein
MESNSKLVTQPSNLPLQQNFSLPTFAHCNLNSLQSLSSVHGATAGLLSGHFLSSSGPSLLSLPGFASFWPQQNFLPESAGRHSRS